jgi:hypothetical protein
MSAQYVPHVWREILLFVSAKLRWSARSGERLVPALAAPKAGLCLAEVAIVTSARSVFPTSREQAVAQAITANDIARHDLRRRLRKPSSDIGLDRSISANGIARRAEYPPLGSHYAPGELLNPSAYTCGEMAPARRGGVTGAFDLPATMIGAGPFGVGPHANSGLGGLK